MLKEELHPLAHAALPCRGLLLSDTGLANYTSWRVGGLADFIYIPADLDDLKCFMQHIPSTMPMTWLGLGSNVLIRDGGLAGIVIITQGKLNAITVLADGLLRVEAGVACAQIARYTARLGLTGLEFMAGIPGTVGGALAMNAGCYGSETWQTVTQVEVMQRGGNTTIQSANLYEIGYRQVKKPDDVWFIAGYFQLALGNKDDSLKQIRTLLAKRNASQPTHQPNCGSVFRNPPGLHAAQLIQAGGLKGYTIGQATVSEKHANFIVNTGQATADDIEKLITHVANVVEETQGVRLQREVCIMGRHQSMHKVDRA